MKFPFQQLLLKRLLLAYAIYTVCRILFISFNLSSYSNQDFQTIFQAFLYGLVFDTSAIVYTNALFIFMHILPLGIRKNHIYQLFLKWYFIVVNSAALLLNLADTGYYPFSGKRSGMELFTIKQDIADQLVSYITDYWYLTLALAFLIFAIIKIYNSIKTSVPDEGKKMVEWLLIPVWIGLSILGARGGWNLKPVSPFDAARMVKPEMVSATINTPFQMIISIQQTGVEEVNFMPAEKAKKLYNPVKSPSPKTIPSGKNIVLIIVESLGKEYIGYYNNGKGYTPFIDSLIGISTHFENAYANGKRSITGLPAVIASMPSWMEDAYTGSFYQSNRLVSTGGYLQQMGYEASFYHGARNGSMSFDNFISITNGGRYSGLNEYPRKEDYDGSWGIFDDPYLQYIAREMNTRKQPFFTGIFTLSSHHPYRIPENVQHLFKGGTLPIHRSIEYADYSLKRFFETASNMPWFKNTVFVITADHSAENETPAYQTMEGLYRIPLIIYDPSQKKQLTITKTVQQIDMLPAMLTIAGYNKPYFAFGNNPLDTTEKGYAIQYNNNIYQIVEYPYVLFMANSNPFLLWDLTQDTKTQVNLMATKKEKAAELTDRLKAVIQTYNYRLIKNKTVAE